MHDEQMTAKLERLRKDPITKRIAARLGVSLETLLAGVPSPGPVVDVHGGQNIDARLADIEVVVRRGIERAKTQQSERAQRRDGFTGERLRRLDITTKKTILGEEAW
jgi:hypothetical protein